MADHRSSGITPARRRKGKETVDQPSDYEDCVGKLAKAYDGLQEALAALDAHDAEGARDIISRTIGVLA